MSAHPTISDVALAAVTRQTPTRMCKGTISDANAKGVVQVTYEVYDPDPQFVLGMLSSGYEYLRSRYPRDGDPVDLESPLRATVNVIEDERAKRRPRKKAD